MALAEIIDLDEVRRARRATAASEIPGQQLSPLSSPAAAHPAMWCCYWVPVMYWYVP